MSQPIFATKLSGTCNFDMQSYLTHLMLLPLFFSVAAQILLAVCHYQIFMPSMWFRCYVLLFPMSSDAFIGTFSFIYQIVMCYFHVSTYRHLLTIQIVWVSKFWPVCPINVRPQCFFLLRSSLTISLTLESWKDNTQCMQSGMLLVC